MPVSKKIFERQKAVYNTPVMPLQIEELSKIFHHFHGSPKRLLLDWIRTPTLGTYKLRSFRLAVSFEKVRRTCSAVP